VHGALALACLPPASVGLGCGAPPSPDTTPLDVDGWQVPRKTALTSRQYATLAAAMDAMIPGAPSSPGAADAHAAWYVDQFLSAFDVSPPRIFAGGPYSGRHGGQDGFSQWLPLTRIEELRWRTFLEGSQGIPEREWNGPVKGLRAQYEELLDALEAQAQKNGVSFAKLTRDQRRTVLLAAGDFVDTVYVHAVEGTYGDPVYGGNFEGGGWRTIGYEGDRHPIGYTEQAALHPEDPA
jgi:hypothetical protein